MNGTMNIKKNDDGVSIVVVVMMQNAIKVVFNTKYTKRYKIHKNNLVINNTACYVSFQSTGTVFSEEKSWMSTRNAWENRGNHGGNTYQTLGAKK